QQAEREAALAEGESARQALEAALAEREERLAAARAEAAAARQAADEAAADLAAARSARAELASREAAARREIAGLEREVETGRVDAINRANEAGAMETEINALRRDLEAARQVGRAALRAMTLASIPPPMVPTGWRQALRLLLASLR